MELILGYLQIQEKIPNEDFVRRKQQEYMASIFPGEIDQQQKHLVQLSQSNPKSDETLSEIDSEDEELNLIDNFNKLEEKV